MTSPLDLVRAKIDRANTQITGLALRYRAGAIPADQFMREFRGVLKDTQLTALKAAQKRLNPAARTVTAANRDLYRRYAERQAAFMAQMEPVIGDLPEKRLAQRARLYMQSSEGLYHQVVAGGQPDNMVAVWRTTPAEHCDTCVGREGQSWPARQVPFYPRDGNTECRTNCKCFLEYRTQEWLAKSPRERMLEGLSKGELRRVRPVLNLFPDAAIQGIGSIRLASPGRGLAGEYRFFRWGGPGELPLVSGEILVDPALAAREFREVLMHELAHGAQGYVDRYGAMEGAWAGYAKTAKLPPYGSVGNMHDLAKAAYYGLGKQRPVSVWALAGPREYWAESLSTYLLRPAVLKRLDPVAWGILDELWGGLI